MKLLLVAIVAAIAGGFLVAWVLYKAACDAVGRGLGW